MSEKIESLHKSLKDYKDGYNDAIREMEFIIRRHHAIKQHEKVIELCDCWDYIKILKELERK